MKAVLDVLQNLLVALQSGQIPEWGLWSYAVLALLVAVEGPIATLLGAAAASAGVMKPGLVFIAASTGNLIADTLWYGLGYLGKSDWLYWLENKFGVTREQLEKIEKSLHVHAAKVLFFAKLSVSLVIPTLMAAGLVKVPWRKWFPFVCVAEMIWTGSLVLIGFYTTETIKRVEQGLDYIILLASIVFVIFLFWLARRVLGGQNETVAH